MPKPYSQDLRDRVIDAVERGEMSLAGGGASLRSERIRGDQWLERVETDGSEPLATRWPSAPPS